MWNLTRLRTLREFEQQGTISRVAESLGYSVSSVSQHMSQLEQEVGHQLLEPDGRRIRLTSAGRTVARYAEEMMRLEERCRAEIGAPPSGHETLRVATIASATRGLLPRVLDLLARDGSHLKVELFVVPPEEGLTELEARRYDLVIAEQYPGHTREQRDGIDFQHLGYDPIRVVLPHASPARSLAELRDSAWVMEPPGSAARYWAVEQCRASGFEPQVRFQATDLDSHIALVASGHAVGLLPDLVWSGQRSDVRLLDLPTPLRRELITAVRASSTHAPGIITLRTLLGRALAVTGR